MTYSTLGGPLFLAQWLLAGNVIHLAGEGGEVACAKLCLSLQKSRYSIVHLIYGYAL